MRGPARAGSPVLVVGAGWAGLACAVRLARRGVPCTVLESARQMGGRARRVRLGGMRVDNGQHLLLGAYHGTLSALRDAGVEPRRALRRMPLELRVLERDGPGLRLATPRMPAPLHLALGLLRARGLAPGDRRAALALGLHLRRHPDAPRDDIPVAAWLAGLGQTPRARALLWEPLCLAALNTPPEAASARIYARVLRDALLARRADSDLLLPRTDLGAVFPEPAAAALEGAGGQVELGRRVTGLLVDDGAVRGVRVGGETLPARHVVLATSAPVTARLLAAEDGARGLADGIARLRHQPICTAYLQYPEDLRADHTLTGLAGATTQWVVDRAHCGQPGLMAAVVSAHGPHMRLDARELGAHLAGELAGLFPHWPAPRRVEVVREKRATFSCEAGVDRLRPPTRTPLAGLWLAGDYTATPYPGTLEGAVRSGLECAEDIAREVELAPSPSREAR